MRVWRDSRHRTEKDADEAYARARVVPGRPYGVRNEAVRIVREVKSMKPLGAGPMVKSLVGGIRAALQQEMDASKLQIAAEVTGLLTEVRQGTQQVINIVQAGVKEVRDEFSEMIGNAHDAADEVAADARAKIKAAQQSSGAGAGASSTNSGGTA
jgi:hypothetical protein